MADPGDLAAAYVTILPNMDEFAEKLAADLESITRTMHPTVTVEAELDMGSVEATLEAFTKQEFTVRIGVDDSFLRNQLVEANALLQAWSKTEYNVRLGADDSFVRAALVEVNTLLDAWSKQEPEVHLRAVDDWLKADLLESIQLLKTWAATDHSVRLGADYRELETDLLIAEGLVKTWAAQDVKLRVTTDVVGGDGGNSGGGVGPGVATGGGGDGGMRATALTAAEMVMAADAPINMAENKALTNVAMRALQSADIDHVPIPTRLLNLSGAGQGHPAADTGAGTADNLSIPTDVVNAARGATPNPDVVMPVGGSDSGQSPLVMTAEMNAAMHSLTDALIASARTAPGANALLNARSGAVPITEADVDRLVKAKFASVAEEAARDLGLSTQRPSFGTTTGGGGDNGPPWEEMMASSAWVRNLTSSLDGLASKVARSGLPGDIIDPMKGSIETLRMDLLSGLEDGITNGMAKGLGDSISKMQALANLEGIPYKNQGAEGTADFFGGAAAEDALPSPDDIAKTQMALNGVVNQVAKMKADSTDTKSNFVSMAQLLQAQMSGSGDNGPTAAELATTTEGIVKMKGELAALNTLRTLAGAAGGGGGGIGTAVGLAAGSSGDEAGGVGSSILKGLAWGGGGHIPGAGVSRWIPALPFLAGMGSLGSLAGAGPEHVITTLGGIAGSGVMGALGGGLLAAGGLGVAGVGMGTDLAGTGQAMGDAKQVFTAQQAVGTAVNTFGPGSLQAAQAMTGLTTALAQFSPVAQGAVSNLATVASKFRDTFDQMTGVAEKEGANLLSSLVKTATPYLPVVGMFAAQNTSITSKALQAPGGIESYLDSSKIGGGLDIFTQLEQTFQKGIPTAMAAANQGLQVFEKSLSFLAPQTGGFLKSIDALFTKMNTPAGMDKWDNTMQRMISDFESWKKFLEEIAKDLHDIFKDDAGLGQGIIDELTQMLTEANKWITSTSGKNALTSLFTVHKQQVEALLQIIPGLVRALEPILKIMPAMTTLTLPFINGLVDLLNIMERLPGGVGPAIAAILGFSLLLGKLAGWGNAFGFLKTLFTTLLPAVGSLVEGMVGWTAAIEGTTAAWSALRIALGATTILIVAGALYEVFHKFGTIPGILATLGVALIGLKLAMNQMGVSSLLEFFTGLIAGIRGTGAAAEATSTEVAAAGMAEAEAWSESTAAMIADNEALLVSLRTLTGGFEAEGLAAATAGDLGSIGEGLGVTAAGGLTRTGAEAAGGAATAEEVGAAGTGLAEGAGEAGLFSGALAGVVGGLGAVVEAIPPVAVATAAGVAAFALYKAGADGISGAVKNLQGNLTNTSTTANTTLGDLSKRYQAILEKQQSIGTPQHGGVPGWLQPLAPVMGPLAAANTESTQAYDNLGKAADTTKTQIANFTDNLKYLEQHFHISGAEAAQLAQGVGIDLANRMDTGGTKVHQMAQQLAEMSAQAGIGQAALFAMAQRGGESVSQLSQAMSQAGTAAEQLMQSFTNLPTGATALQSTLNSQASTALSNSQQAAQLQTALASAQQQLATDQASGAISIAQAQASAAQGGTSGVASAVQSAASQVQQDNQAIQQAQTALQNFNATVAQTAQQTAAALSTPPSTILAFYQTTLAQATQFNNDINQLMQDGFSPQVVNQIVTAGVQNGLATANGLLQGVVSDGGKAFVSQVNGAANALSLVSMQAIEQAKLMQAAVSTNMPQKYSMAEPVVLQGFDEASANGPKGMTDAMKGQLDLTSSQLQSLAAQAHTTVKGMVNDLWQYGFTVPKKVADAAEAANQSMNSTANNAASNASKMEQSYLKALSNVHTAAGAKAMGASGYVPGSGKPVAGTGPVDTSKNFVTGTRTQDLLGGTPLLHAQGEAAGTAAGKGLVDGVKKTVDGNAGAKPAGKALVDGIVDGISANQAHIQAALLTAIKAAITSDAGKAGGQAAGVAIVNGVSQGISSDGAKLSSALLTAVKTAITGDAGKAGGQAIGTALINGIDAGLKTDSGRLTNNLLSTVKGAISADVPKTGGQAIGTALINGIVDGISKGESSIESAVNTVMGKVKTDGQSIGAALMQGVATGVQQGAPGMLTSINNAANMAVMALKNPLQISSPSQVFHGLGVNMMEGLANGIAAGFTSTVLPAMGTVATGILKASSGFSINPGGPEAFPGSSAAGGNSTSLFGLSGAFSSHPLQQYAGGGAAAAVYGGGPNNTGFANGVPTSGLHPLTNAMVTAYDAAVTLPSQTGYVTPPAPSSAGMTAADWQALAAAGAAGGTPYLTALAAQTAPNAPYTGASSLPGLASTTSGPVTNNNTYNISPTYNNNINVGDSGGQSQAVAIQSAVVKAVEQSNQELLGLIQAHQG